MIELSFYISPEDQERYAAVLEKMGISDREFLYRAFLHYLRLEEKKLGDEVLEETPVEQTPSFPLGE